MEHYSDPNLKIFALSSNRPLAAKIAEEVGLELGKVSVTQFSDGEIKINIDESVRGLPCVYRSINFLSSK